MEVRLYDKRDDFDLHVVNSPFLSTNISSGPSYRVYISQVIRYARCCSYCDDFKYRHKCLVDRLLLQGVEVCEVFQEIEKCQRSVKAMVNDSWDDSSPG